MSNDPYKPPTATLEKTVQAIEVPAEIAKKIKNCWVAGLISITITLIFMLIAFSGSNPLDLDASSLIDVVIMGGLTFGVYKNSRICAVLLLALFLLNKAIMWGGPGGKVSGLPLALVFFWFFLQGVVGTFQLHKLKKAVASAAPD